VNTRIPSDATTILAATALVFGVAGNPSSALASVIYDNSGPDLISGLFSDVSDDNKRVADDFSFATVPHEVSDIHWFGGYCALLPNGDCELPDTTANPDDFTIRLHSNDAGLPDTADFIEVFTGAAMRTDTGLDDSFGLDIYEYSVDIDPVTLQGDTTYWLSIFNDAVPNGGDPWFWATSDATSGTGNSAFAVGEGSPWIAEMNNFELAFNLTGASAPIPEPGAAFVFSVGCLFVSGASRRRRPRR